MNVVLVPGKNPPEADMVMTPSELVMDILHHFSPRGTVMEPCRGTGNFYRPMTMWPGITNVYYRELSEGLDYFSSDTTATDWTVTNPPWSKFKEFLRQAMATSDNVLFLATLTHFVTRQRMALISAAGFGFREALLVKTPKKPWPQNGFQLAAVHLQRDWKGPMTMTRNWDM